MSCSQGVAKIAAREMSVVDPLPVTEPLVATGEFVLSVVIPVARGSPTLLVVNDQAPPDDAELVELRSGYDDEEFADFGCYADGSDMRDDSDCMDDWPAD